MSPGRTLLLLLCVVSYALILEAKNNVSRFQQERAGDQTRKERGLSGCRKGLKTVPLAQALLNLKPDKTIKQDRDNRKSI